jgi:hypothetical protein
MSKHRGRRPPALQRRFLTSLGLCAALALSGCGGLKLHSDARQKQGEDAAKAWKEVNLKPLFDAERDNQAKLLDAELSSWNRHLAEVHTGELRDLAKTPVGSYPIKYDALLRRLAGTLSPTTRPAIEKGVADALDALERETAAGLRLARSQSFLQSSRVPKFTCEQLTASPRSIVDAWTAKNPDVAATTVVVSELRSATDECKNIASGQNDYVTAVKDFDGGDLKKRVAKWSRGQTDLKRKQAAVDAAVTALNTAQATYDTALKAGKPDESAVDKAKDLAKDVASKVDALEKIQGVFGIEAASEERIKRIDDLLASLQSGEPLDTETASKLEVAISMFPKIKDDLAKVKSLSKGTAAVPLLIQRDVEQAKVSSARVEVVREKQRVELLAVMVLTTVQQADTVLTAIRHFEMVSPEGLRILTDSAKAANAERDAENAALKAAKTPAEKTAARRARAKRDAASLDGLWQKVHPDDRREVLESTVYYLDAYSRQETTVQSLETRSLAISSERAVDLAEINASLWVSLINATVTQAAEYSALGFKASDFEKILNLIALGYIGHGVNK